jgi:ferredoxin
MQHAASDVFQSISMKYRNYKSSPKHIRIILNPSKMLADVSHFSLPSVVVEIKGVCCKLCLACFLSCPATINPQALIKIPNQT